MTDQELVDAGLHLSMVGNILDAFGKVFERLHISMLAAAVYSAWPEIKGDIEELLKDAAALVAKVKAIQSDPH